MLQGSIWVCGSVWKCSFLPPHAAAASLFESFVGKAHGSHPPTTPLTAEASFAGLALKTRGLNLQGVPFPTPPPPPMLVGISGTKEDGIERERGVSVADSGDFFLPFCSTVGREGGSVGSLKGTIFSRRCPLCCVPLTATLIPRNWWWRVLFSPLRGGWN